MRTQTILHGIDEYSEGRVYAQHDDPVGFRAHQIALPQDALDVLGSPDEITLTIEAGDTGAYEPDQRLSVVRYVVSRTRDDQTFRGHGVELSIDHDVLFDVLSHPGTVVITIQPGDTINETSDGGERNRDGVPENVGGEISEGDELEAQFRHLVNSGLPEADAETLVWPNGRPAPELGDVSDEDRARYEELVAGGLTHAEAQEEVWPTSEQQGTPEAEQAAAEFAEQNQGGDGQDANVGGDPVGGTDAGSND